MTHTHTLSLSLSHKGTCTHEHTDYTKLNLRNLKPITSTETISTDRNDGEPSDGSTPSADFHGTVPAAEFSVMTRPRIFFFKCCFTITSRTGTIRTIKDGEPGTATSTDFH